MKGRIAMLLATAFVAAVAACSSDSLTGPSQRLLAVPDASLADLLSGATVSDSSTIITEADTTVDADSVALESAEDEPAGALAYCPATSSRSVSSKYIGSSGGTIKLAPFTLKFPAGSLSTTQLVTLRRPSTNLLEIIATVGDTEHYDFAAPVEFVVRVSKDCPSITPEMVAQLKAIWVDAPDGAHSLKTWRYTSSGKIRFLTDHFSSYGIAW